MTPLCPCPSIRLPLAPRLVSAIAFVGTLIPIVSRRVFAARVRSHRNAAKSSWRRVASNRTNRMNRKRLNEKLE